MRIIMIFLCIFFFFVGACHREEEISVGEKEGETEKITVVKPAIIFEENGIMVTEEEIESYIKEIEKSIGGKLNYNQLKEIAIQRAIIATAVDLYFEENGIKVKEEELDNRISNLHYSGELRLLLDNFRFSELERIIKFEVKVEKLIQELIKEKELTEAEAKELITEEVNQKITELFDDAKIMVVPALWI